MTCAIAGIGTALPPYGVEQHEAAEFAQRLGDSSAEAAKLVRVLYRRAGVKRRHSVVLTTPDGPLDSRQSFFTTARSADDRGPTTAERMRIYETAAGELAVSAAGAALRDSSVKSGGITHLITVSCSGFYAPGFDAALIRDLGLPTGTARTHVGFMGCHGALNGLRLAEAFTAADSSAQVLLCALELCTVHQQYGWHPDRIVANALFADGAAALVVVPGRSGFAAGWNVASTGSGWIPDSEDAMTWRIGDHGFEMTLSPQVPELIHRHLRPWLTEWLQEQGLSIAQVGSWAIHPGGPRILSACAEAIGIGQEQLAVSYEVLAECGNMSSPTVLFILQRLRERQAKRPCVMLGFGPGLAIEAALLR